MIARAQRSRACTQCRERRVKCDETPGACQQCKRLGLTCSGPVQGSVIIDMTEKVTRPRAKRKSKSPHPKAGQKADNISEVRVVESNGTGVTSPQVLVVPNQSTPLSFEPHKEEEAIAAIRWQYKLPMLYQPSNADVFDHAFSSHFVALNKGVRTYNSEIPWITQLPGLHAEASNSALQLSIRATSMAFYAKLHKDVSVLVDSYKWYIKSLNTQRMLLSKLGEDAIPNDEEVLVPLVLGLYEIYAGTSPTGVFQHLTAAMRILEMRGPQNCTTGVTFSLFRALRVSDAHMSIIFNRPSLFSSPEWMSVPFQVEPKNAHQQLIDVLLAIPDCLGLCSVKCSLAGFFSRDMPATTDLTTIRQRAVELLDQLSEWAERHPHLSSVRPSSHVMLENMTTPIDGSGSATPHLRSLMLPDTFVALTAGVYKATHLILTLLLHKISPESSYDIYGLSSNHTSSLLARAKIEAEDIVEISEYVDSTHPIGFDFMRSVFPLVVVAIVGPTKEEQAKARRLLERWRVVRSIGGICSAWVDV